MKISQVVIVLLILFTLIACNKEKDSSSDELQNSSLLSASGVNINNLLSSFDRAVEDYLSLSQKALAGDLDAVYQFESSTLINTIHDIATLLQQAEERGEITVAHKARMDGIHKKYENIATQNN